MDVGMYTVEVVLTYSNASNPNTYQTDSIDTTGKLYEGYMIPSFPRTVYVIDNKNKKQNKQKELLIKNQNGGTTTTTTRPLPIALPKSCTIPQLTINNVYTSSTDNTTSSIRDDILKRARWVVVETVRSRSRQNNNTTATTNNKSFLQAIMGNIEAKTDNFYSGYINSYNSIGFHSDYQYNDCHLIANQDLVHATTINKENTVIPNEDPLYCLSNLLSLTSTIPKTNILLFGDSVMRIQNQFLENFITDQHNNIRIIRMPELYCGPLLSSRLGLNVSQFVEEYNLNNINSTFRTIVVYNTGLHDVDRICSHSWNQEKETYMTSEEFHNKCADNYHSAFQQFTNTLLQINNIYCIIFQTTTAAWLKYGNWGFGWYPAHPQTEPVDTNFVDAFNTIAIGIIQNFNNNEREPVDVCTKLQST
jgi:hypothetical protein